MLYISDEDLTLDDTLENNSLFDDHQGIEKDDFFSDTSVENDQGKNNTGRDIEEGVRPYFLSHFICTFPTSHFCIQIGLQFLLMIS